MYAIFNIQSFKHMLTNDIVIVSFEQLGPGREKRKTLQFLFETKNKMQYGIK